MQIQISKGLVFEFDFGFSLVALHDNLESRMKRIIRINTDLISAFPWFPCTATSNHG